jgi:hypothetical protein
MSKFKLPKCIRCGVCCVSGTCPHGIKDINTDICIYLELHGHNKTSCKLMKEKGPSELNMDIGCYLRTLPDIYNYYYNQMVSKISGRIIKS